MDPFCTAMTLMAVVVAASVILFNRAASVSRDAETRRLALSKRQFELCIPVVGGHYTEGKYTVPMTNGHATITLGGQDESGNRGNDSNVSFDLSVFCPSVAIVKRGLKTTSYYLQKTKTFYFPDSKFSEIFRVQGPSSSLQSLLTEPIRSQLNALPMNHMVVRPPTRQNTSRVQLQFPGHITSNPDTLKPLLQQIQTLKDTIEALFEAPWRDAEGLGLTLDIQNGLPSLHGQVDGCPVRVTVSRTRKTWPPESRWMTEIHLPAQGPKGIHIIHERHRRVPKENDLDLRNPVVGQMLSVTGDDLSGINALFQDPGFIDNALPLIHGHPGSEITEEGITVRVASRLVPDLKALIQHGVALATALKDGSRLPKEPLVSGVSQKRAIQDESEGGG